jgi:hypothetical protein
MITLGEVQVFTSVACALSAAANLQQMRRWKKRDAEARALLDSLKVVGKVEPDGDGFNVYLDPKNIPLGEMLYTVKALKPPQRTMTL